MVFGNEYNQIGMEMFFINTDVQLFLSVSSCVTTYGLPTRLLDWSSNPLKALYFAVENPNYDDVDGVVWAFQPEGWYTNTPDVENINSLIAFHTELVHERINAQDACFTAFPLPDKGFNVPQ